ncbi:flagellar biosynthesis protein P [Plesiocystis pacifica SIR-1]|uniref:Flagellar biosynthesis protein P n=1 Tax=Plesiocystis pacifica SIR-1 TaxID=391625 RepID=A6GCE6_9BACT|nr:flagellar biosynthesis protein P [Plesiocystis pacifica SIR-1]
MGTHEEPAQAGFDCPEEGECTFKKPNIMFIVDNSTSMNEIWDTDNNLTRWQVSVAALQQIVQPGSFLSQNTHLALMRFGHDPSPAEGTTIPADSSGIVDGQALDVAWDDDNAAYYPCNGQALLDALDATPAPANGALFGIGTWTNGALQAVSDEIDATKADHPADQADPARAYVNVLLTDGAWTGQDGTTTLSPASQNPANTTADLFDNQDISTYVVAVAGDPAAEMAADETAAAGGTDAAIDGNTPEELEQALANVVQNIISSVVAPECIGGLPRVMILLDASSSMLNIGGGTMAGGMGETGWDQAREALAGEQGLFDIDVGIGAAEDVTQLGLAVFGHNQPAPGEQNILVQYAPCAKDNFAWALDPNSSCVEPGCTDPWGGPPIAWTYSDGQQDPPGFDIPTTSHMPQCAGNTFCSGSGTYTHLGLQLIKDNQVQYQADGLMDGAEFPTNDETIYFNILITDGQYNGYSTNAQVQGELEEMYNDGITTYVIGFGDGVDTPAAMAQLQNMAQWGSGDSENYYDANNQAELEAALTSIFGGLEFDPCCAFNDCSETPEPTTLEPDPIPDDDGTTDGPLDTDTGDTTEEETTEEGTTEETTEEGTTEETTEEGSTDDTTESTGEESTSDDGNDDEIGAEETGTGDAGSGDIGEDDGCNCSTSDDDNKTRGLLGTFLVLGFAGLIRRRRRD